MKSTQANNEAVAQRTFTDETTIAAKIESTVPGVFTQEQLVHLMGLCHWVYDVGMQNAAVVMRDHTVTCMGIAVERFAETNANNPTAPAQGDAIKGFAQLLGKELELDQAAVTRAVGSPKVNLAAKRFATSVMRSAFRLITNRSMPFWPAVLGVHAAEDKDVESLDIDAAREQILTGLAQALDLE